MLIFGSYNKIHFLKQHTTKAVFSPGSLFFRIQHAFGAKTCVVPQSFQLRAQHWGGSALDCLPTAGDAATANILILDRCNSGPILSLGVV